MKNHLKAITICLLFLLPVSMCKASDTVKVAAIFEISGPGASTVDGMKLAVDEINDQGGLLGRQIELMVFDNESKAIRSRYYAKKALEAGVVAVFGSNMSSNSVAIAPIFQKAGIPMISPYSTNPKVTLTGDYIFRVCFIDPFQGTVMAEFARKDLKAKNAVILVNATSRYSEGLADYFESSFRKKGGNILIISHYLQDSEDFSTHLKAIKEIGPDVVFVPGYPVDSGRIIRQARNSGIAATFLGGDGWSDTMYEHGGYAIHGSYYSDHWHRGSTNPKSIEFINKFRKKYDNPSGSGAALSYDMVLLFADAVKRAGSIKRSDIRDAIASTQNFKGVTGTISFDKNGNPVKSAVILKFEHGSSVFVKSIEP